MAVRKNVLMPEYAKDFQCLGGACEENCCTDWFISIDKATYKKYMSCPDLEFREKLKKYVVQVNKPYAYAQMKYAENGYCAFLTDDNMCALQRKFGADFLSITCRTYPRSAYSINGNFEMSLYPSCPEVARYFLDEKRMRFTTKDMDLLQHARIILPDDRYEDFLKLRDYIIFILQDRRYIFEMRLILLGLFIQKLTQNEFKNIPGLISTYKGMFSDTSIADEFFKLPVAPDFQFDVITGIFSLRSFFVDQPRYVKLFNTTLRGLGFDEGKDTRQRLQSYIDALVKYEESFLKWDHVMENFFVNTVFSNPLPLCQLTSNSSEFHTDLLWNEYLFWCLSYRMLKFHLTGMNNLSELDDEAVVSIVSKFHRAIFGHDGSYMHRAIEWVKEQQYDTLAYMSLLIRT